MQRDAAPHRGAIPSVLCGHRQQVTRKNLLSPWALLRSFFSFFVHLQAKVKVCSNECRGGGGERRKNLIGRTPPLQP